ncbi:TPA: putative zinc ribbon protein, partial [Escherichia coli]
TVKVRKWFCVMCDENYEGEKCCPRCGTGVYSRAWGRQEVPSEDARADNPLQRL